jgi:phosphoglycolate phosphatase-like HAD superfamily hydrolase
MADTLIVDLDGTLIDSNYQHAMAWFRAFRAHDLTPPLWRIHRAMGMGGDQLVSEVSGPEVEASVGESIRTRWRGEYELLLPEVRPFEGARLMLAAVREHGLRIVFASSSPIELVERYLSLLGGEQVADAWTSADDIDQTKPAPDLLVLALSRVSGRAGVTVGDSVWDMQAAQRAAMPAFALRTGGYGEDELRAAGAIEVYESLSDLAGDVGRITGA